MSKDTYEVDRSDDDEMRVTPRAGLSPQTGLYYGLTEPHATTFSDLRREYKVSLRICQAIFPYVIYR